MSYLTQSEVMKTNSYGTKCCNWNILMQNIALTLRAVNTRVFFSIFTSNLSQSVDYNCSILSRYSFWACQRGRLHRRRYPRRAARPGGRSWQTRPRGRRCAPVSTARPPRRCSPTQHGSLGSASPSTTATPRRATSLSAPTLQPSTPHW